MTSCPTSWAEPICSRHRHSVLEIYRSVSRSFTQTETPSDARFWWAGAAPHERITGPDRPSATFPHRVTPWSRAATRAGGGGRRRATGAASPSNADPWPKPARYVLPLARRRAQKPKKLNRSRRGVPASAWEPTPSINHGRVSFAPTC